MGDSPLADGWPESESSFPDTLPFLEEDGIREAASWTELTEEAISDCLEVGALFRNDPNLEMLAWHAHRLIYRTESRPPISKWPAHLPALDSLTGAFYLLIALSGIDAMVRSHQAHGIPEAVSRLNCRDIHIWASEYHRLGEPLDHGFVHTFDPPRWGLHTRGFQWIAGSLVGRILRLNRLQFIHAPYRSAFRAYRHTESGRVQVVAEAGHRFTDAGWKAKDDDDTAWPSEFKETAEEIRATPVRPTGHAQQEPITLSMTEWQLILKPEDPILEIHIPEDGRMGFDECGASIQDAIRDFTTYFPEKTFKAVVCRSWLLDPQYQDGMPRTSNIFRFQRECYLYPIGPGSGRCGFFRLFTHDDLATLPRDTVMRRTYLDLLEAGGLWRGGGMMLFPEDLDWGKRVYLEQHGLRP
ncbi:MAG: hypothetical protein CME19_15115 [Gemmatimonadetes bacterium]|nr:hypothetical protein [Gemmatimonadota bacterium]